MGNRVRSFEIRIGFLSCYDVKFLMLSNTGFQCKYCSVFQENSPTFVRQKDWFACKEQRMLLGEDQAGFDSILKASTLKRHALTKKHQEAESAAKLPCHSKKQNLSATQNWLTQH